MSTKRLPCTAVFTVLFPSALFAAATQPNIWFMLTDEQGDGDIGRHGVAAFAKTGLDSYLQSMTHAGWAGAGAY